MRQNKNYKWIIVILIVIVLALGLGLGLGLGLKKTDTRSDYTSDYTIDNFEEEVPNGYRYDDTLPYVISLLSDPERIDNINNYLKKRIPNLNIWRGIDGKKTDFMPYIKHGYLTQKYERDGRLGALGCLMSHVLLWKHFLTTNYNHLLVLEDDAELVDQFLDKFIIFMSKIPMDYDYNQIYTREDTSKEEQKKWKQIINNSKNIYCPGVVKGVSLLGTVAYCISRKGVQKLLKKCLPFTQPIDEAILRASNIERYTPTESLALMPYKFSSEIWTTSNKNNKLSTTDSKKNK